MFIQAHTISYARLSTGFERLDKLLGGGLDPVLTVFNGCKRTVVKLGHYIAVSALSIRKEVYYVCCDNGFDPYLIGRSAERAGLDASDALSRIFVARAFNRYQLREIVGRELECDLIILESPFTVDREAWRLILKISSSAPIVVLNRVETYTHRYNRLPGVVVQVRGLNRDLCEASLIKHPSAPESFTVFSFSSFITREKRLIIPDYW